jgi:CheY-like chemotaxis protein
MSFHCPAQNRRRYVARRQHNRQENGPDRPRILVVDDEAITRHLVADDLLGDGYRVWQAANALEALAIIGAELPFDMLLTDVDMPGGLSGIGLVEFVKEIAPATRVIVMSGGSHRAEQMPGIDLFIRKPTTSQKLRHHVARLLELRQP